MSKNKKEETSNQGELKIEGLLSSKGVSIKKKAEGDALTSRGYGVSEDKEFFLAFYEALYLVDKGNLGVKDEKGRDVGFRKLLRCYEDVSENAWAQYLVYRDLRGRGYVIREGFGVGVDFRVYERGDYSKDTAKYLVLSLQEGKPVSMADLATAVKQAQSSKKELILAVMNRRGEIVYYSIGQLTSK